jgi:DeoR/GlpR family transcriptional regulator of sugar metabolism
VSVFLVAGQLLARQATLLGEAAVKSLGFWRFDVAFLSAEGMDESGIWNSQTAIVEQQKVVIARSSRSIFCLDSCKLNRQAAHFLLSWNSVEMLLTDTTPERLKEAGVELGARQYWDAKGGRETCPLPPPQGGNDTGVLPVELL